MKRLLTLLVFISLALGARAQTLPGQAPWVAYFQPLNFSQQPLPNRLVKIQAWSIGVNISNAPVVYDVGSWYSDAQGFVYITNPIIANYGCTITAPPQATTIYFPLSNILSGNLLVTNFAYMPTNFTNWQLNNLTISNTAGIQSGLSGALTGGGIFLLMTNATGGSLIFSSQILNNSQTFSVVFPVVSPVPTNALVSITSLGGDLILYGTITNVSATNVSGVLNGHTDSTNYYATVTLP